jgi:hypothetical protein
MDQVLHNAQFRNSLNDPFWHVYQLLLNSPNSKVSDPESNYPPGSGISDGHPRMNIHKTQDIALQPNWATHADRSSTRSRRSSIYLIVINKSFRDHLLDVPHHRHLLMRFERILYLTDWRTLQSNKREISTFRSDQSLDHLHSKEHI